jgi:hypothetical protein
MLETSCAKRVYTDRRAVAASAEEMTDPGRVKLEALLDPGAVTTNKSWFKDLFVIPQGYSLLTTARWSHE